jgi:hypothetical protein
MRRVLNGLREEHGSLGGKMSNYAFKPTAGEVFRTNKPLLAGGGLTRR